MLWALARSGRSPYRWPARDDPGRDGVAGTLDFYFDFTSPYGYLAATQIEALAARHRRKVAWKPFLLGVVFRQTGQGPLLDIPIKGAYSRHDMERTARYLGVPFRIPSRFPVAGVAAGRAVYWAGEREALCAGPLALALYNAYFVDDRDISDKAIVADVCAAQGFGREEVAAALEDPAVKDLLRRRCDDAAAAGAFGSPFIVADGEAFWGVDKLPQLERWLETGGW